MNPPIDRRSFLRGSVAAAASGLATTSQSAPETSDAQAAPATGRTPPTALPWKFCTFIKSLQHLGYASLAAKIAPLGFDGLEVPIRPNGYIIPTKVEDELPKLVAALEKHKLEITIMASGINEVSDQQRTEAVLRSAADLGIKRFRMAYYKYDLKRPIPEQLDEFRPKLKDLIDLCRELGIKPVYQNHSGRDYVGAPIWDLHSLLVDHDPDDVGMAFDIAHATIEGATCWPINWELVRPWVDTVYVKEPRWGEDQRPKMAALGSGAINKGFYRIMKQSGFDGPISLHVEYLDHSDPTLEPAFLEAVAKDFATLKGFLQEA